jgi:hypothetical protein
MNEIINECGRDAYYVFVDEQFKTKSGSLGIFDSWRWFEINLSHRGSVIRVVPQTKGDEVDIPF